MDVKTLKELITRFENCEPAKSNVIVDFCEGYNAAFRNVVVQLRFILECEENLHSPTVVPLPLHDEPKQRLVAKPELKPKATAQTMQQPKPKSSEKLEPGELPPGWRFLEVGEFLQNGDVLNSTGFGVDTGGRDDMRCTAKKTWRRKL